MKTNSLKVYYRMGNDELIIKQICFFSERKIRLVALVEFHVSATKIVCVLMLGFFFT